MNKRRLWAWIPLMLAAVLALAPLGAYADTASGNVPAAEESVPAVGAPSEETAWEAADFTYGDYEKELYGCDYTREFTVSGKVVTGFSEAGLTKLESNKNLVLPAKDDAGNMLVGVGEHAFEEKGLESVTFPTGMMIPYDDTVTHRVSRRGNYIIAESAFAKNNLTEVYLPGGVIAVLPNAFQKNQLTKVTIPRTIWWIETLAFANNKITTVSFPDTTDFQFEMHGMAFADNLIKSVVIPDYTEVINKYTFAFNPGMEECDPAAGEKEVANGGVVYMYTDNMNLKNKDRIHHLERPTASQKAWHQKLVVLGGSVKEDAESAAARWTIDDFTVDGTTITGLSESGIAKRAVNKDLMIPNYNKTGDPITALADSTNSSGGLFATADEKFDTVRFPYWLETIGRNAFAEARLKEVVFSEELKEIGMAAFRDNDLTSIVLPDTVTTLGNGAFSSNPLLERIVLSKGLTEIADSAFGCSDAKHYMTKLTEIEIPDTITRIGKRAFAGNNFLHLVIPDSVKTIDEYAFSSKNYLRDVCTVELPEGLTTLGNRAFRNRVIEEITLPTTLTELKPLTFEKEYSDDFAPAPTKVYVKDYAQYENKTNFPDSDYHQVLYAGADHWTAEDFTYGTYVLTGSDMVQIGNDTSKVLTGDIYVITGLSDIGVQKLDNNKDLVIPVQDPSGKKIQGVGADAFKGKGITSVTFSETERVENTTWTGEGMPETRGDFFIIRGAFSNNAITSLELPEGVLFLGYQAFNNNRLTRVNLPASLMVISNQAFNGNTTGTANQISAVEFPAKTDFPLFIGQMAFGFNRLESVQLPEQTAAVHKMAFIANPGKEAVIESATTAEKKGGVVWMYINDETPSSAIAHTENTGSGNFGKSNVQKLISGSIPAEEGPWNAANFTYSEDGTVITGLSDSGKLKLQHDQNLVLPDESPAGVAVTEIGASASATEGTFRVEVVSTDPDTSEEVTTVYVPHTVKFPAGLKKIGNYAFVSEFDIATGKQDGLTSVEFPETLEEIGTMAFRFAPLTSVAIPDSVTKIGIAAFVTAEIAEIRITSAKLPAGLTDIPANLFNAQNLAQVEIPESVTSIGNYAFNGSPITELTLPQSLTKIGNYAFQNHQLSELEIPAGVKTIGTYAFKSFKESAPRTLASLTLNEGLTSIGKEAFYGSVLKTVDLPESLTTLNIDAFKNNASGEGDGKVLLKSKNSDQAAAAGTYTRVVTEGSGHKVVFDDKMAGTGWSEYDFTYSEDGTTLTGWSASGNEKRLENHAVVLPDKSPAGVVITAIADDAFALKESEVSINKYEAVSPDGIQTVALPTGLTSIGVRAFEYNNLQEISFAETPALTTIGASAFHGNHLKTVVIPDSVTTMGEGTFAMNDITELTLSKNVTVIPQGSFAMNIRMDHITIPDTVTEIGEMAFAGARLEALEIPASVTKVGRKAFHLHRMTELTIPGTVKEIGDNAFEGTFKGTTLKTLVLEEGIETIGAGAFKEGLLETVALPNSLVSMGTEPFENNTGAVGDGVVVLTSTNARHLAFNDGAKYHRVEVSDEMRWNVADFVIEAGVVKGLSDAGKAKTAINPNMVIPETDAEGNAVTEIAQTAFNGVNTAECKVIESVVIPDSVTVLGNGAFTNCTALAKVSLSKSLTAIPQAAFTTNNLKTVEIPEGVISIGNNAFNGNFELTSVTLPSTLETIGSSAFGNAQLTELVIPASVKSIGNYAFRVNNETLENTLASVTLNEGLVSIGNAAFGRSALTSVDLPSTVTTLNKNAFKDSTNIVDVHTDNTALLASDNPAAQLNIVLNPRTVTFDANNGTVDPASAQTGAKGTLETLPTPELPGMDFLGWFTSKAGTEQVAADKVYETDTTIYAHWNVDEWSTEDFTIEEGEVKGLSEAGQAKAKFGTTMVIPEKDAAEVPVTKIAQTAFANNLDITAVVIPDTITTMGNGVFTNCKNLESVVLSKSLTAIPQAAFTMNNLKTVEIPEGVTSVGNNAFAGNLELTAVTLPSTLETIGNGAFGNAQLTELVIPASVKSIGNYAFRVSNETLKNTLTSVTLNEGLVSIGNAAFGRSALTSVDLPSTVTTLHKNAFAGSTNTVDVHTDNAALLASDNPASQLNIVLAARTVTFDAGEGTVEPASAQTGAKGTLEEMPEAVLEGYTCAWYTEQDGGEEVTTATVFAEPATIFACWTERDSHKVSEQIKALPDPVDPEKEEDAAAVAAAREAYDALPEEEKALVAEDVLAKLETAEKLLTDTAAAKAAAEKIEALPETAGSADEAAVKEAREAYDALSDEAKAMVSEDALNKLTTAEKQVADAKAAEQKAAEQKSVDQKAADTVATTLKALPKAATAKLADAPAVAAARKAYDALTPAQKAMVPAEQVKQLEDAEKAVAAMQKEAAAEEASGHPTLAAAEAKLASVGEGDPANAVYRELQAQIKKTTKSSLKVQWKTVKGASGYAIYAAKYGKSNKYVKVADAAGTKKSFTLKTINGKKLSKKTYYKVVVMAYKLTSGGEQRVISTSKSVVAATAGGKNSNPTKITAKKKKVTVKVKKKATLKYSQKKKSGTKVKKCRKIRFESSNTKVATVSKKGVVKGVKKGKCTIYVYAQNGLSAKVKVTVKK